DDPAANLPVTQGFIREAALGGAQFVLTPEVTNCLSSSRRHQQAVLQHQDEDQTLKGLRETAAEHGIWLLIGSLALKTQDADGRFANRSFLIAPDGSIKAWYDKIHMFDVQVSPTETYRESDGYRPGSRAVTAEVPFGRLGMTICYDVRFPYLHRTLTDHGATILTAPAAFSPVTGQAHWEPLLRARAIENTAYVLAPAQCGSHDSHNGKVRKTHGHSIAISPWGEVLAEAGDEPCVTFVDLDTSAVEEARQKVPSLTHTREFETP
ncbi:MAG: carbon-nitrogen hydrolase family protein, partial [Pseudomonadota bacterium]|nr:carbon-nitrogen hydrolase family protein [Pseudomonadota bacterium]